MTVQSTWVSNYYPLPYSNKATLYPSSSYPLLFLFSHCLQLSLFHFYLSLIHFFVFSPITEAYHSAYQFVRQAGFSEHVVTRAEYAENGSNASRKKFRDWKPQQESEKEKLKEASKVKGKQREDDRTQVLTTRMTKTRNKLGAGTPTSTTTNISTTTTRRDMPLLRSSQSSPPSQND